MTGYRIGRTVTNIMKGTKNSWVFWIFYFSESVQAPINGCLLDDLLSNRSLFLTWEAGKSEVNVLADSVSGEDLFPARRRQISLYPHIREGTDFFSLSLSGASFIWALVPFIRWVISLERFCLLIPSLGGLGQHRKFWRAHVLQSQHTYSSVFFSLWYSNMILLASSVNISVVSFQCSSCWSFWLELISF